MSIASVPLPRAKPRSVSILGSTGSIGCNTLNLIAEHTGHFTLSALTAQKNVQKLIEQALTFRPQLAVIGQESHYETLKKALAGTGIRAEAGMQAIADAASHPSDIVISAIVGAAGLAPTLAAIRRGALIGLANKECLVCAGELVMREVQAYNATLLPVDSEHNAIFQLFDFKRPETVDKITITASGGPFRTWTQKDMARATPAEAVKHPKWNMGAKISVDSATLMNKGLEMIEAYHLFPLTPEQIEVIVHPESIVHGMVHYRDGSVLSHMGTPDMRTPIAYTLGWPERISTSTARLDFAALGSLHFEKPDEMRFPALLLAREALKAGGIAPTILNAANEVAVERFLKQEIRFLDIIRCVEHILNKQPSASALSLTDIMEADAQAREFARNFS